MTAGWEAVPPGPDAMARTVAHLAQTLSSVQRRTLRALAGVEGARKPRAEWVTTYERLHAMGLIDRVGHYGGQVTEIGNAVVRRLP